MKMLGRATVTIVLGVMTAAVAWADAHQSGYSAKLNYTLHCEGCHKADGSGQPGFIPALTGIVSTFLAVPEGRAYLVRVPGTAQSLLNDREAAAVLNWVVRTFDPEHLPADFVPYSAKEVAQLRRSPISQASVERARVIALLEGSQPHKTTAPEPPRAAAPAAEPPQVFAICGACHPVSKGGEHAIGPNLRGVVGRHAGSGEGFVFSKAMRDSGIVWTRAELDQFLANPPGKVAGTLMNFGGFADPKDRQAVLDYLETLR